MKTRVDLNINERRFSFLCWGGCIDAVLFRHFFEEQRNSFRGCRSSFVDKLRQRRSYAI